MLGEEKDILDKNNYVHTSLMKTGGCRKVTANVPPISGQQEKHRHGDMWLWQY